MMQVSEEETDNARTNNDGSCAKPPQSIQLDEETYLASLNLNITTLVDVIEKLTDTQKKLYMKDLQNNRPKLQRPIKENEASMERNTVRLDGIEVYAVVSALTVASSIACLDSYGDTTKSDTIMDKLLDICFVISNSLGILSALHATLVFSLVTMYGRTAVGLGRDIAFSSFFQATGVQRYRGFQTFLWSLYAFMVQVVIVIVKRMFPFGQPIQCGVFLFFGLIMFTISSDTNTIVKEASVIFDTTYGRNMSVRSLNALKTETSFRDRRASLELMKESNMTSWDFRDRRSSIKES